MSDNSKVIFKHTSYMYINIETNSRIVRSGNSVVFGRVVELKTIIFNIFFSYLTSVDVFWLSTHQNIVLSGEI